MKPMQTCLLSTALIFGVIDAAQALQPNFYECTGRHVHATLSVGGQADASITAPQTTLNLEMGKKSHLFNTADITREPSLIGELWEVTLKVVPDLYVEHATLIVPSISIADATIAFDSQLVLTRVNTPFIAQPPSGVVNSSRYIPVKCSASMVFY